MADNSCCLSDPVVREESALQTLTIGQAETLLKAPSLRSFYESADWRYLAPMPCYQLPVASGQKVGLARIIANVLLDRGPVLMWITETGIFRSAEHLDLIVQYRRAIGEARTIHDAPVQLFETGDRDTLISFLCVIFFFYWGAELTNLDRSLAFTISHDEWIEFRHSSGNEVDAKLIAQHFAWLAHARPGHDSKNEQSDEAR